MRKLFTLLALLLLKIGCAWSQSKGLPGAKAEPDSSAGKVYALVIGISDYAEISDLKYADRDATVFYEYLRSAAGGNVPDQNIIKLINQEATRGQVLAALYDLAERTQKGDRVYVYFSGHGDVDRIYTDKSGYLLTYRTNPRFYDIESVSINSLQSFLVTLSDKNTEVIMITDACRAGELAGNKLNGTSGRQITAEMIRQMDKKITRFLSCQPSELSLESTEWGGGRGLFSYHFVRGLLGLADTDKNGTVSLNEMEDYLLERVYQQAQPNEQTPIIDGNNKRQIISHVDAPTLAALHQADQSRLVLLMARVETKGWIDDILTEADSQAVSTYRSFELFMKYEQYELAYDMFLMLEQEKSLGLIISYAKRNIIAALLDNSQGLLAKLYSGELAFRDLVVHEYGLKYYMEKLLNNHKIALEILGSDSYLYSELKSQKLLFEALFLAQIDINPNTFLPINFDELRGDLKEKLKSIKLEKKLELKQNLNREYLEMYKNTQSQLDKSCYKKMICYLDSAISLNSSNKFLLYFIKACTHSYFGLDISVKLDSVKENLNKSIDNNPNFLIAIFNLGIVQKFEELENITSSRHEYFFEKCLSIDSTFRPAILLRDNSAVEKFYRSFYSNKKFSKHLSMFSIYEGKGNLPITYGYENIFIQLMEYYIPDKAIKICKEIIENNIHVVEKLNEKSFNLLLMKYLAGNKEALELRDVEGFLYNCNLEKIHKILIHPRYINQLKYDFSNVSLALQKIEVFDPYGIDAYLGAEAEFENNPIVVKAKKTDKFSFDIGKSYKQIVLEKYYRNYIINYNFSKEEKQHFVLKDISEYQTKRGINFLIEKRDEAIKNKDYYSLFWSIHENCLPDSMNYYFNQMKIFIKERNPINKNDIFTALVVARYFSDSTLLPKVAKNDVSYLLTYAFILSSTDHRKEFERVVAEIVDKCINVEGFENNILNIDSSILAELLYYWKFIPESVLLFFKEKKYEDEVQYGVRTMGFAEEIKLRSDEEIKIYNIMYYDLHNYHFIINESVKYNFYEYLTYGDTTLYKDECISTAYSYLRIGNQEMSLKYFQKIAETFHNDPWPSYHLACYYAITNSKENAIKYLDQAIQKGFNEFDHARTDSDLENIQSLPEFKQLIQNR